MAVWAETAGKEPSFLPIEDFARSPDLSWGQLSPDGKFMGYLFTHEGRPSISFLDLATGKARYYDANVAITGFLWVSDSRVVVQAGGAGLGAVSRNASGWIGLTGFLRLIADKGSTESLDSSQVLYTSGRAAERVLLLEQNDSYGVYPDVLDMDTTTGRYRQHLKNPGNVMAWMTDWRGEVCFGLSWDGKIMRLTYRETPTAPWQNMPNFGGPGLDYNFVGLDQTGRILHVAQAGLKGRWAIFPYDLEKKQLGQAIFEHDEYDILPDYRSSYAGQRLAAAVYSAKTRKLLGVRYVTEGPRQYWFDPTMVALQKQIDAMHPDLTNLIVNIDFEEDRLLVLSWSDREPGIYSLVDLATQKVNVIGRRMPWIKPEQMAEMFPIEFKARDGLPLHGYLTLPSGRGQKNLPLVLLVRGDPWVRDVWGFDPLVQFLANRGYAVLQINYRGTAGYGVDFAHNGKGQIGGAIQDDIADGVRWAVKQGIADAGRVAIMGSSYGGFNTLVALAKTPELYRCGIDIAGVTDWSPLLESRRKGESDFIYAYWDEKLGLLEDEKLQQQLVGASPVKFADQIKTPLLIVHGKEDKMVPVSQAKQLVALMKKQGREPATLYFSDLGHSLPQDKQGVEFLNKLEAFLAANLGK